MQLISKKVGHPCVRLNKQSNYYLILLRFHRNLYKYLVNQYFPVVWYVSKKNFLSKISLSKSYYCFKFVRSKIIIFTKFSLYLVKKQLFKFSAILFSLLTILITSVVFSIGSWTLYAQIVFPIFIYLPVLGVIVLSLWMTFIVVLFIRKSQKKFTTSPSPTSKAAKKQKKTYVQAIRQLLLIATCFIIGYVPIGGTVQLI